MDPYVFEIERLETRTLHGVTIPWFVSGRVVPMVNNPSREGAIRLLGNGLYRLARDMILELFPYETFNVDDFPVGLHMESDQGAFPPPREILLGQIVDVAGAIIEHPIFAMLADYTNYPDEEATIFDYKATLLFDANDFLGMGFGAKFNVEDCDWVPKGRKQPMALTYGTHTHNGQHINCAAFALTFYDYKHLSKSQKKRDLPEIKWKALNMMHYFGWDSFVSVRSLKKYVEEYPTKRIVVLSRGRDSYVEGDEYHHVGSEFNYYEEVEDLNERRLLVAANTIYLGLEVQHFFLVSAPQQAFKYLKGKGREQSTIKFCDVCLEVYHNYSDCVCERGGLTIDEISERKNRKRKLDCVCKKCNEDGHYTSKCPNFIKCVSCEANYKKVDPWAFRDSEHLRCLVQSHKSKQEFQSECVQNGKKPHLWAYDLEAAIKREQVDLVDKFMNPDGTFKQGHRETIRAIKKTRIKHKINMVVCVDVFTKEKRVFTVGNSDGNPLRVFIEFARQYNKGNNVFVAHNGSGYDTRFVFEEMKKTKLISNQKRMTPLMRGSKFLEFRYGETIFRDSLLHLKGSLADLAKDFLNEEEKGHFPHRFNTQENYGKMFEQIPDLKYFDLCFMISKKGGQKQLDKFMALYNERANRSLCEGCYHGRGPYCESCQDVNSPLCEGCVRCRECNKDVCRRWYFDYELLKYCELDVDILAKIMLMYHDIFTKTFPDVSSPWFFTTAPSYVFTVVKEYVTKEYDLPPTDYEDYFKMVDEKLEDGWVVLTPTEYKFARQCLRGGRTEVKRLKYELSEEELKAGYEIAYVDYVSMYPYFQMTMKFPVGQPKIFVYDRDSYPCLVKSCHGRECHFHSYKFKTEIASTSAREDIHDKTNELPPTHEDLMEGIYTPEWEEKWFGLMQVDMDPPNDLFCPVLPRFDGKCKMSLEPIHKGYYSSVEIQWALKDGYKLKKLYQFYKYKPAEGLWNEILGDLFIKKESTGNDMPLEEEQLEMYLYFVEKFGQKLADKLKDSFPEWEERKAMKMVFKIALNSIWGKHAENPNKPDLHILDPTGDCEDYLRIEKNIHYKKLVLNMFKPMEEIVLMQTEKDDTKVHIDYHAGYLPCAVFVTAYGRLGLYKYLRELGVRVIYMDTDSIFYLKVPGMNNIPEGNYWGQMSVEKVAGKKKAQYKRIIGMVCLGPKSYAVKCEDGTEEVKLKGVALKHFHEDATYESIKQVVDTYIETGEISKLYYAQMQFGYNFGEPVSTGYGVKEQKIDPAEFKGVIRRDLGGLVYPFGHKLACWACSDGIQNQEAHTCLF